MDSALEYAFAGEEERNLLFKVEDDLIKLFDDKEREGK
jgi:hypothetical protein